MQWLFLPLLALFAGSFVNSPNLVPINRRILSGI